MAALPHRPAALRTAAQGPQYSESAVEALHTVSIGRSPAPVHGTSVTLAIALDEDAATARQAKKSRAQEAQEAEDASTLRRRDSLKRREAVLKGKEGSRRRQRWENDRLISNPWAQPPLPSDWSPQPTHPRHVVPYFLAPLWDAAESARRHEEQYARAHKVPGSTPALLGRVPKELRERIKRTKAARGLLQDLEETVRRFVATWEAHQARLEAEGLGGEEESDEEIVFVGRDGGMADMPSSPGRIRVGRERGNTEGSMVLVEEEPESEDVLRMEKLVFDAALEDRGAAFRRWLVHSIATYYGLKTWSVTKGDPARREAYVGIRQELVRGRGMGELPVPLWGMV